ncbi:MAG: hypothetical protein CM15mP44_5700 [Candidatus Neomarinimicrobiota bacterium]|nr:MAG: hypothetical protein CM15mP44_5700 [Candidatus Neomarinimicrobiota bacterium]
MDEIGEAPLETQVKLLRVLESGNSCVSEKRKLEKQMFRVIAATNKSLSELVKNGDFREDLYFRLKTVMVQLPPLRKE